MKRKLNSALSLIAVLALVCMAGVRAPAESTAQIAAQILLDDVGEIRPVNQTRYLLIQQPQSGKWGIWDTSGNPLTECELLSPTYLSYGCFSDKADTGALNCKALAYADSAFLSAHEYGEIRVFNHNWAAGWVLSEAAEDAFDYKASATAFYNIERCDVFHLGDEPYLAASLSRDEFDKAAAHGDYLSILDRGGKVTVYDRAFSPVELRAANVADQVYAIVDYAVVNRATGEMILDGYTECREVAMGNRLLLQLARLDYSGKKSSGIVTDDGEWLLEMDDTIAIKSIRDGYALIAKEERQGLYSLTEKRYIVPCLYDSIAASNQALDPYISNGCVCAIRDDVRYYIDARSGETLSVRAANDLLPNAVGTTMFIREARTVYTAVTAAGRSWQVRDQQLYTSRGDGSLIVARSFLNNMYGVYTADGILALDFKYRFKPTITDDGHVVIRKYNGRYSLIEISGQ